MKKQKYLWPKPDGTTETPAEMFWRVASTVAAAENRFGTVEFVEATAELFYDAMATNKFTPNTPTLVNAGKPNGQLAACFVLPVPDNIPEIYDTLKAQAMIQTSGGGTGFSGARIRCKNSPIGGTGKISDGSMAFLDLYNFSSWRVLRQGAARKGANMWTLPCLAGETGIKTIDGIVSIKDLVGRKPYLYSTDGDGDIFVQRAKAIFANGVKRIYKVIFDDMSEVRCTADHRFMLSDGTYVEANKLKRGDSMMRMYRRIEYSGNDKQYVYISIANNSHNSKVPEHRAIMAAVSGASLLRNTDVHHKNKNGCDNRIDNLQIVTQAEHAKIHADDSGFIEAGHKFISDRRYLEEPYKTLHLSSIKHRKSDHIITLDEVKALAPQYSTMKGLARALNCDRNVFKRFGYDYVKSLLSPRRQRVSTQATMALNHKVMSVVDTGVDEEVYDITMDGEHHNFALANDVFVHNCWHADIEEFIDSKLVDGKLSEFNISVGITDAFMKAVENDDPWDLLDPKNMSVVKTVMARYIMDKIIDNAWKNGEPGLLFIDEANRSNPTPHLGKYEATNPCFHGDTLIATENGLLPIADIVHNKSAKYALGPNGTLEEITGYWDNGVKPLYRVTTRYGYYLDVTADHKWDTDNGQKVTSDLVVGDRVTLQLAAGPIDTGSKEFRLGELIGWLIGDGYLSHSASKSKMAGIIVGRNDFEYIPHIQALIKEFLGKEVGEFKRDEFNTIQLLSSRIWTWAVRDMGIIPHKSGDKEVPECILASLPDRQAGFLRGLFSADGQVFNRTITSGAQKRSIRLTSKSKTLVDGVQLLLAQLGISSNTLDRSRPARNKVFNYIKQNGEEVWYGSDGVCYELDLQSPGWKIFKRDVGFVQRYKNDVLDTIVLDSAEFNPNKFDGTIDIISIEQIDDDETFNLTVSPSHKVCANGIVIPQCGEQWLLPFEACTLGHLNLVKFLRDPNYFADRFYDTWDSHIDFDKLVATAKLAVRFLDNVIEINHYPLPQIEQMHKYGNRKIGVGVMGLADLLVHLGVSYGSQAARDISDYIDGVIEKATNEASEELAIERGPFPNWFGALEAKGVKRRRNANIRTVAPTGSTSIVAGSVGGGIEPFFGLVIVRDQAGMKMYEVNPTFARWLSVNFAASRSKEIVEYVAKNGTLKGVPYCDEGEQALFAQANDISPQDHIRMQAIWQSHTDNSISKTINFANSATKDDVREAYMLAWQLKCKGVTVYRDNSRVGQVLNQAASTNVGYTIKPPDMPVAVTVTADGILGFFKSASKAEQTKALAEILTLTNKAQQAAQSRDNVTSGTMRKIPTGCGNSVIYIGRGADGKVDDVVGKLGKSGGCASAWWEALGRITSIALRNGVDPADVRKQLTGISCHLPAMYLDAPNRIQGQKPQTITSCADALATALLEEEQSVRPVPPIPRDFKIETVILPQVISGVTTTQEAPQWVSMDKKHMGACPDCGGSQLDRSSGCLLCVKCGFSLC
jgi:ribonucleoside-diphosphate reductase alpha chain